MQVSGGDSKTLPVARRRSTLPNVPLPSSSITPLKIPS
jgi:hypothetical protein